MQEKTPHVVIFGGGIAGALLAKSLYTSADVSLIDPLDFFEVPMSAPRSLVDPPMADKAIMRYRDILPDVEHIHGRLVTADLDTFLVERHDGSTTLIDKPDAAVFATGSRFSNPLMRAVSGDADERREFYRRFGDKVAASRTILIVGGGPIGVETAGELVEAFPQHHITLIEGGPRLLRGSSALAGEHAKRFLERRGVEVLLNESLDAEHGPASSSIDEPGVARTSDGRLIRYDMILWCIGGRPNTAYMKPHLSHLLDEHDRIKVTPTLQIEGHSRLFALGDVTNLAENKMAWHTMKHVKIAAHNLIALLNGPALRQSDPLHYHPKTNDPTMIVTLGKRHGIVQMPEPIGFKTWSWLARVLKADHMLVPKFRKLLQAK